MPPTPPLPTAPDAERTVIEAPAGMVRVTQMEFFAAIAADSRDIMPTTMNPNFSSWETRNRAVVGRSYPGWRNPGDPKGYFLVSGIAPAAGTAGTTTNQGE